MYRRVYHRRRARVWANWAAYSNAGAGAAGAGAGAASTLGATGAAGAPLDILAGGPLPHCDSKRYRRDRCRRRFSGLASGLAPTWLCLVRRWSLRARPRYQHRGFDRRALNWLAGLYNGPARSRASLGPILAIRTSCGGATPLRTVLAPAAAPAAGPWRECGAAPAGVSSPQYRAPRLRAGRPVSLRLPQVKLAGSTRVAE